MSIFKYSAKRQDAQTVSGEIQARSKEEAIEKINQLALIPVTIEEVGKSYGQKRLVNLKSVGLKEVCNFSRQLANLNKAGLPLIRSLQIIEDETSSGYFKQIISNICAGVRDGRPFSDCLEDYPKIFTSLYVAMVRAGEESGNLKDMLFSVTAYYREQIEMNTKIKTSLAYPIIMLVLGIGTVFFMLTFVMPQITQLFSDINQSLPLMTAILLKISQFLRQTWMFIALFTLAVWLAIKRWVASSPGHRAWSSVLLLTPFLRDFIIKVELSRFCRTLELLLKSGVPIIRSMQFSTPLVSNDLIRDQLNKSQEDLVAGGSLGTSLKESPVIPRMVGDLISVGEESGSLSETLSEIGGIYEQETNEVIKLSTTLLEPLMIVLVGGAIGFIVFAILLPIFQIDMFV